MAMHLSARAAFVQIAVYSYKLQHTVCLACYSSGLTTAKI